MRTESGLNQKRKAIRYSTTEGNCSNEGHDGVSAPSDEVAEWLRRWTANPLCSARVGSNPTLVVRFSRLWRLQGGHCVNSAFFTESVPICHVNSAYHHLI